MTYYRIEIVIPYVVDEMSSVEEAEAYGEYLANANGIVGMGTEVKYFEVRAHEVEGECYGCGTIFDIETADKHGLLHYICPNCGECEGCDAGAV